MNWVNGTESRQEYEQWKADWQPPKTRLRAIAGRVLVEFSPYVTSSSLAVPEQASYQAIVVHDSGNEIPTGTEVTMLALNGQNFTHEDRIFTFVSYDDILGVLAE